MKISAVNGSPRKGNTDFLLDRIIGDIDIIRLRDKNIGFCNGLDSCCPVSLKCDKSDDMEEIYKKLESSDVIILASPTYFSNVTATMKNFMDRCNPYYYNKKLKDKKFFLIAVGGYEPSIKDALQCMRNFLKGIYAKEIGVYYAVADKINDLKNNSKIIKEIQEIKLK
ncbi:MAG: flavodoxin family protein [Nanoarchaeota archaeon]